MRLKSVAAIVVTAIVGMAMCAPPADAQSTARREIVRDQNGRIVRDRGGRPRTRVVVQPRSYLDAGTNVRPGERKFTDYIFTPTYGPGGSPTGVVTNLGNGRPGWDSFPGQSSWSTWGPGFSGW